MLKSKFKEWGHMLYADNKMENWKSKGCAVIKCELPEVAERVSGMMNEKKLIGREIEVQIDSMA